MAQKRKTSTQTATQSVPRRGNRRRGRAAAAPEEPKKPRIPLRTRLQLWGVSMRSALLRVKRPLVWTFRAIVVLGTTAGAVATGRLVERYVRTADAFATRAVEIGGNSRLSEHDLLDAAGLALGQNIFDVSPEDAEARLLAQPWIAEAHVQRRLPGTYRVDVRERSAAALLVLDRIFLVGDDGTLFKPLEPGDPTDLPVVTGIDPERFAADAAHRQALLVNVVALMHDYRDAGLWRREPIAEIHMEPDEGLVLYVGDDAALVRVGKPPFRQKLHRLRGVLDQLGSDKARPAYVYLDNQRRPDRVTVRLR